MTTREKKIENLVSENVNIGHRVYSTAFLVILLNWIIPLASIFFLLLNYVGKFSRDRWRFHLAHICTSELAEPLQSFTEAPGRILKFSTVDSEENHPHDRSVASVTQNSRHGEHSHKIPWNDQKSTMFALPKLLPLCSAFLFCFCFNFSLCDKCSRPSGYRIINHQHLP